MDSPKRKIGLPLLALTVLEFAQDSLKDFVKEHVKDYLGGWFEPWVPFLVHHLPFLILAGINLYFLLKLYVEEHEKLESERPDRISVLAFFKECAERGVDLMGSHHAAAQIAKDLRQAALDGHLKTWGKNKHNDPFVLIPTEHWKHFKIDWATVFEYEQPSGIPICGFVSEESMVASYGVKSKQGAWSAAFAVGGPYTDIHLERKAALVMIKGFNVARIQGRGSWAAVARLWHRFKHG
jgi:hypothetical protein